MSDKPQHGPGVSANLSSGYVEKEKTKGHFKSGRIPPRVSRETLESTVQGSKNSGHSFDRVISKESIPPEKSKEDILSSEEPFPSTKNKRSSVYVYLAVLFGAAFLMLLLAYFIQQRNNATAMDDLRSTSTASRQELLENIETLESEKVQLQNQLNQAQNDLADAQANSDTMLAHISEISRLRRIATVQKRRAEYVFYIGQFIDNGDYPMASLAIMLSAEHYMGNIDINGELISVNPAIAAQYDAYCHELSDKSYFNKMDVDFANPWNPSQNQDMAALGILWCALDQYFILGNSNAASQYLYSFPLADPSSGYQDRVEQTSSQFTLEQYQILKDDLTDLEAISIDDQGAISCGPWGHSEEGYNLPFELPESSN